MKYSQKGNNEDEMKAEKLFVLVQSKSPFYYFALKIGFLLGYRIILYASKCLEFVS